jgi:hypothetical protein
LIMTRICCFGLRCQLISFRFRCIFEHGIEIYVPEQESVKYIFDLWSWISMQLPNS